MLPVLPLIILSAGFGATNVHLITMVQAVCKRRSDVPIATGLWMMFRAIGAFTGRVAYRSIDIAPISSRGKTPRHPQSSGALRDHENGNWLLERQNWTLLLLFSIFLQAVGLALAALFLHVVSPLPNALCHSADSLG